MKLSAYIDGGSRGNPGEAGIGVYFPGVVRIAEYLGTGTNNYAEYSALRPPWQNDCTFSTQGVRSTKYGQTISTASRSSFVFIRAGAGRAEQPGPWISIHAKS